MRKPVKEKLEEPGAEGTEVSQQGKPADKAASGFQLPPSSLILSHGLSFKKEKSMQIKQD